MSGQQSSHMSTVVLKMNKENILPPTILENNTIKAQLEAATKPYTKKTNRGGNKKNDRKNESKKGAPNDSKKNETVKMIMSEVVDLVTAGPSDLDDFQAGPSDFQDQLPVQDDLGPSDFQDQLPVLDDLDYLANTKRSAEEEQPQAPAPKRVKKTVEEEDYEEQRQKIVADFVGLTTKHYKFISNYAVNNSQCWFSVNFL